MTDRPHDFYHPACHTSQEYIDACPICEERGFTTRARLQRFAIEHEQRREQAIVCPHQPPRPDPYDPSRVLKPLKADCPTCQHEIAEERAERSARQHAEDEAEAIERIRELSLKAPGAS